MTRAPLQSDTGSTLAADGWIDAGIITMNVLLAVGPVTVAGMRGSARR